MTGRLSREAKVIGQIRRRESKVELKTPIATDMFMPNHSGDHSSGRVNTVATTSLEILNKQFIDDGFAISADNNTNDVQYTAQVLHGTDATPPTANTVPRGTIYIQYTP